LLTRMSASPDGGIDVEGGMHYRALVVPERCSFTPDMAGKLDALSAEGAMIVRCDRGEKVSDVDFAPDVKLDGQATDAARVMFFHRALDDGRQIYYGYNHTPESVDRPLELRDAHGKEIEEWHPSRLTITPVADGRLHLAPYEAKFYITK
ncbi:MAG: hypothetical protein K2K47_06305, partial [Duncaniella sp.]|nr:hypothetical protein [Duncaniella sp.]